MNDFTGRVTHFLDQEQGVIAEFGHAVRSVFPVEDNTGPAFAYTVGRALKDKPDLLITGNLHPNAATALLNMVAAQMDDDSGIGHCVSRVKSPGAEYGVQLIPVTDLAAAEMTGAIQYGATEAFQVVWPDMDGVFPWEPRYDRNPLLAQPLYGEVPS